MGRGFSAHCIFFTVSIQIYEGGSSGRLFCMQRPGVNHSYHPVSRLWAHQKRHQWFSSSEYHLSTSTLVSLTSWCCLLRRDPPAAFINILPPLRGTHFHLRTDRLRRLTSFITSLASQQSHQSPPPVSPLYWVGGSYLTAARGTCSHNYKISLWSWSTEAFLTRLNYHIIGC